MSNEMDAEQYFKQMAAELAGRGGLSGSGSYFKQGIYDLTLKRAFAKRGHRGASNIFEFRVEKSSRTSGEEEPNAPGSTVSQVLKPTENSDYGLVSQQNLMKIAAAFANVDDAAFLTEAGQLRVAKMLAALFHASNPCRGMAIRAEAFPSNNKKGEDRTYVKFSHDPAAFDQQEVARRRQSLDTGG